jgi:hypothetical protein
VMSRNVACLGGGCSRRAARGSTFSLLSSTFQSGRESYMQAARRALPGIAARKQDIMRLSQLAAHHFHFHSHCSALSCSHGHISLVSGLIVGAVVAGWAGLRWWWRQRQL